MEDARLTHLEQEVEDLRQQVKQLLEARRRPRSQISSHDGDLENPFAEDSGDEETQRRNYRECHQFHSFGIRVDIPEFEGKLDPEEFLD